MCSLFNKDLAMANAIEITKAITPAGFIPNYQSPIQANVMGPITTAHWQHSHPEYI